MYSVVCRKVHESRFTLAQLQRSIQRARRQLDHERIQLTPELMDELLLEREVIDHKAPFTPSQPTITLIPGNFYLKSVDERHRRTYEKYVSREMSNNKSNGERDTRGQELYTKYFQNHHENGEAAHN